ncbi:MAG: C1 family peptidase, partial [Actinomycetia bacterium]|nr:C1 family peptidase [Actinomycetes bacterium]
ALAAVANYLIRTEVARDEPSVSPRMMYEMAQEYDGEAYDEGSTLRGALKGWSKLGIASMEIWPYDPDDEHGEIHGSLNLSRVADAGLRPMGPYRRISPHTDIEKMQASLARQTPLFASALLHTGWFRLYLPETDGVIHRHPDDKDKGGHAFVIVGYDERGFWLHNSFGEDWGKAGYGLISYDDWITQGLDVWVPSLGIVATTTENARDPEPSRINGGSAPDEVPVEARGDGFQRAPARDAHGAG